MIRLALAYLFRRPVQVLAVMGVAIGLCALLTVNSVMNGLIQIDREDARGPLADLLLIPAQPNASQASSRWENYQKALAQLQSSDGPIEAVSPHLMAYAILGLRGGESLLSRTSSSDVNGV
ncbi:MAG: ABC transporter permease, partial [Planctomycetota bacterium]|nr:ABC transporter permease [Planctomycetota bacterium]